jgi:hypothetical protein
MLDGRSEVWYGTWPPELKGEVNMTSSFMQRWGLRLILFSVFLISVLIWRSIPDLFPAYPGFWVDLLEGVLEAIAIAMVIGITVDVALKKAFGREVFLASVGYILPTELRPEMVWLCQLNELCTQDTMICKLIPLGNYCIRFQVHRTQVVKNIGRRAYDLPLGLAVDEWFIKEDTIATIKKFSFITTKGTKWPENGQLNKEHLEKLDCQLRVSKIPKVRLGKDEQITIISEFEEIYPRNGYFHMHIKYATSGARVTVTTPDDIGVQVAFTHREGQETLHSGHDYVCPFTLLPYQRIGIRFWDKTQSEKWKSQAA